MEPTAKGRTSAFVACRAAVEWGGASGFVTAAPIPHARRLRAAIILSKIHGG